MEGQVYMNQNTAKISFLVFFVGLIALSLWIIKPFITVILAGSVIAFVFYPVFRWMHKRINNRTLTALLLSLLIVILFSVPLFLIINSIYEDTATLLIVSKQRLATSLFDAACKEDTIGCTLNNYFSTIVGDPKVKEALYASVAKFTFSFASSVPEFVASIPRLVINVFILVFIMFYFFKDGDTIQEEIKKLLPFDDKFNQKLVVRTKTILHATVYGAIVVAVIQGILATIGYLIFQSVTSPFLWGALTAIAALLPIIGTALVWLPIGVLQVVNGALLESPSTIWKGVGLIVYGTMVISMIDNIIKPNIIGSKSDLHPVLVLLGVLGGLTVIGFIGIVVGPLVLAILMSFIEEYKEEKSSIVGHP